MLSRASLSLLALGLVTALPFPGLLRAQQAGPAQASLEQARHFEKTILPLLTTHCLGCHGEEKQRGGLRLTSRDAILRGGDRGPAASRERPGDSLLLRAIGYQGELKMPPRGRLPQKEIDLLTRWVEAGLPGAPAADPAPATASGGEQRITEEDRRYWAFQPVRRPEPPPVKNAAWVRQPTDAFILAKLEARGLRPAPEADRAALVRRAYYDLLGLPPTPEEIDAFVKDARPGAYERLIDHLLAQPQYGEKWGRHWLDLVRYAETHGYERDSPKPFAWRYRDYVIEAFNKDKPYDRFLLEQLAGDEVDEPTSETLTATGFYRLGIWDDEPVDRLQAHYDILDGVVATTAQVVMGLSLGCARCHGHKKDPFPHRDYYRLLAFFHDVTDMNKTNTRKVLTPDDQRRHASQVREKEAREARLYQEIYALEQQLLGKLGPRGARGAVRPDLADLKYRFYRDTWERLPDFDALKHETAGEVASGFVSLAPASRQEAIGLVFEGRLQVPRAGEYAFSVEATEGVRLSVAGRVILDHPERGQHRASARAVLPAGLVPLRLEYFNTYRRPQLRLSWSGADFTDRPLSEGPATGEDRVLAASSRAAGQVWSYTLTPPGPGWMKPDFRAEDWKKGSGGFGRAGTPGAVVRTPWTTPAIWLRRTFRLDEVPAGLALDLHHDEDVDIYLNGKRVHQAAGYLRSYERVPLGKEALEQLRPGENLLAVHCRQTGGGQYIDVGLTAPSQTDLATLMRREGPALLGAERARRYLDLTEQLARSRKAAPPEAGIEVMCVSEGGPRATHVLLRGSAHIQGEEVRPGYPEVLGFPDPEIPARAPGATTSGKRRTLAEWLARTDNPLTARVMVNRLWQHHFGRGIVPTPSDLGKLGEPPTHPELLDWLASEFMAGGWRLKRMHRLIMTSSAYRMSSRGSEEGLRADPGNQLFWRFNMRRLTAEEVRDTILAVSGRLSLRMGGPSIYPTIPRAVLAGQSRPGSGWGVSTPEEQSRRSIYAHVKRSLLVPILEVHDQADTDNSCPVRYTTTVPTQALGMLNGDFTNEQAVALAGRVRKEAPGDLAAQVRRVIRLTTGRLPAEDELRRDMDFVRGLQHEEKCPEATALTLYCLLALNTNELIYLD